MDTRRLYKFMGYGPRQSEIVFMGLEEYAPLGTLEENLIHRCDSIETPCDDKDRFHRDWAPDTLDPASRTRVKVWMMAAMILRALEPDVPTGYIPSKEGTDWHCHYRALGTSDGTTFLSELFPVPRHKWCYWGKPLQSMFPMYKNADDYQARAWRVRRPLLKRLLAHQSPRLVICYGVKGFPYFEKLFDFRRTEYEGSDDSLHTLATYHIKHEERPHLRVGLTTNGVIIAMTGFFKGQHQASAFKEALVPKLIKAIRSFHERYPHLGEADNSRHGIKPNVFK